MPKKVIRNLAGVCQKCGSMEHIEYGMFELGDSTDGYYEVSCTKCGWSGKEWYDMTFSEMRTDGE